MGSVALGFVGLTSALGLANMSLGSQFLFFKPSLDFVIYSVSRPSPFGDASPTWVLSAEWLLFPAVAVVTAVGGAISPAERGTEAAPARRALPVRMHGVPDPRVVGAARPRASLHHELSDPRDGAFGRIPAGPDPEAADSGEYPRGECPGPPCRRPDVRARRWEAGYSVPSRPWVYRGRWWSWQRRSACWSCSGRRGP